MLRSSPRPDVREEEPPLEKALAAAAAAAAAEEGFSAPSDKRPFVTTGLRALVRPPRRLVVARERGPLAEGGRGPKRGRECGRASRSELSERRVTMLLLDLFYLFDLSVGSNWKQC